MKQTKYVPSGGLAFYEEKEMKKLSKLAKEGWVLEGFAFLGYKLRKIESCNIDYSVDYQKNPDDDYFTYFEAAGWSHVCSSGKEIHIFSAPAGTKPIYSDQETTIEKYEREKKSFGKYTLCFFISTVFLFLLANLSGYGWLGTALKIVCMFSSIGLVFTGMPYIGFSLKLNNLKRS
ncbi:DUF2812 domain-containing protein [Metabacillus fastidiosus]|uniref:DUF2812 domain-containing protein n=1 Tax=Metabacillus fastidiosus TaxID=1458 RepID=UPI002DBF3464|nr:DUF2812 domain-containing protein [Metabacillus fastidiosus]MEC2076215.1 DUF2812 domain-containing protein [Metabacillus fastidiosus]